MNSKRCTILLVEDNPEVQAGNAYMLEQAGYRVLCAGNVAEARACVAGGMPDLLVLDILLPDGSGLAFCKEVRRRAAVLPILFLTALGESDDVVKGLKMGGDDYLAKPYEYKVLLARIEALLRRTGQFTQEKGPVIRCGPLTLETTAMRALVDGEDTLLTPREFAILLALVRSEGRTLPAAELYKIAWGMDANEDVRAVRKHIHRLRDKLGEAIGRYFTLETEYGQGYIFRMRIDEL